jgi:hypothetical protein
MNWKLVILVTVILGAAVAFMAKNTPVEGFDGNKIDGAAHEPQDKDKGGAYTAGANAFDAYMEVHGRPPLSEALAHYRKVALNGSLTKEELVQRIKTDSQLPDAAKASDLKVANAEVDRDLDKLKTSDDAARTMAAPITKATASTAVSIRLQEIVAQLTTLVTELAPRKEENVPNGLESFIGW